MKRTDRHRFFFSVFILIFCMNALELNAAPLEQARVEDVNAQAVSPDRYDISAVVVNKTKDSREIVLRAQIFFFEEASPQGDVPAMILRKDETVVLRKGERRRVRVRLVNEGTLPKGRLRMAPEVRIRRQRVWSY